MLNDKRGRTLKDLRISVTDRCNFRCVYCMPSEVFGPGYRFLERSHLLNFEEIARATKIMVSLGVDKIRLSGGEPLLRRELETLVAMLASIAGIKDIALTTNGVLLTPKKAGALRQAGLKRLTVSLDSLDDKTFAAFNGVGASVASVLAGINNAETAGFSPIKINMLVKRGLNESSILPMARHFRDSGHIIRFIEYMDVGNVNNWRPGEVLSGREIVKIINNDMPLEVAEKNYAGEVANRWRYRDGSGEIGVITSVSRPFCGACSRLRLSAEGKLFTCLFATKGHDLKSRLRDGEGDAEVQEFLRDIWRKRDDAYSETRFKQLGILKKVEMSYIGG